MALVITRRPSEALILTTPDGHRITIQAVYATEKRGVQLTVDAPSDVLITRGELEHRRRAPVRPPADQ
jgi:sRNA-binding carbon storage regulator CsrA